MTIVSVKKRDVIATAAHADPHTRRHIREQCDASRKEAAHQKRNSNNNNNIIVVVVVVVI